MKSKKEVLKNVCLVLDLRIRYIALCYELTAVKVAGKKNTVMAAMILITLLSREVDSAILCDECARLVLVLAILRLIAESRCAMPL